MTKNAAFKRRVRARMEQTNEKYSVAARAVRTPDIVGEALQPGRLTGVVSGGGLTNLAFVMPTLVELRSQGAVLTATLTERRGLTELPNVVDFAAAGGMSTEEVTQILDEDPKRLTDVVSASGPEIYVLDGPTMFEQWREHLQATDRQTVLWVQDIQVGAPLVLATGKREFEEIPEQLQALRDLARETESIIAVGHCTPYEDTEGWDLLVSEVDEAFVLDTETHDGSENAHFVEVHRFVDGQPVDGERQRVDYDFASWRNRLRTSR